MQRYSLITDKMPREFLLLQGTGCRWGKCTFCDYHTDKSDTPFEINKKVLEQITGKYGVIDIINSGSAMELDSRTIDMIKEVVATKGIGTIWFEAHYMYRHRLADFAKQFAPAVVKFRCGVESFDPRLRSNWKKGIPSFVTAGDIAKYFKGVCLLCCTVGDTRERIISDIAVAKRHFEYFSLNLFCNNTTDVKRDDELVAWFMNELYPSLKNDNQVEVLVENCDLGVG
ncbi:MAG: hypothetical protein IKY19_02120 [Bacteroidaceae bacterium]|nr:hypothetical protein [Bacteroidaceae bacterium]MBR4967016.1 hypothetical protein [Bacteroidaceae bacterium]